MIKSQHEQLGLSNEKVLEMYETMLTARKIDERMWLLNRAGKIPFVISCQGHEGAQVGAAYALDRKKDYVLPYYRDTGVVLSFGMTAQELMLSAHAKREDPNSGGRQMPGHFSQRKNRIVTGSSPVATQIPHAAGIALGAKMEGKDLVAFVTLGDGSTNQGDFHEGLNFASVHKLPVIVMVENNKYAISVPANKQFACTKLSDRAAAYGIPGVTVDGTDPLAVYEVVRRAAERARRGEGPTLIEAVVFRMTAHSSDDDDRYYRPREEIEEARSKDPIISFRSYLMKAGILDELTDREISARVMKIVDDAAEYADKAPFAKPEDALKHVYDEEWMEGKRNGGYLVY